MVEYFALIPVRVVIVSRLVYRKGMDFLAAILPTICSRHDDVDFIIGGDGPKRLLVEEVRERHLLMERVIMLGTVEHNNVRNVSTPPPQLYMSFHQSFKLNPYFRSSLFYTHLVLSKSSSLSANVFPTCPLISKKMSTLFAPFEPS